MIWPFKKLQPSIPFAEWAAQQPAAPCGDQKLHYHWKVQGWPCPACQSDKERRRKEREQDRMADLIAAKVAAKLREPQP